MSAAGTPSTDPWVIIARERARYEEQFKSLKPNNGIITGEQAKGFFLQSQLPPLILGQIWALADTDADGKMDINEFSIACKLINLKLRGYEIPKGLPPSLLVSLKVNTPPAIPPLPNPSAISAPPRPEPPKVAPLLMSQSLVQNPPLISNQSLLSQLPSTQTLVPGLTSGLISQQPISIPNTMGGTSIGGLPTGVVPPSNSMITSVGIPAPASTNIPTGIVPPMQTNIQAVQLISGLPPISGGIPPLSQPTSFGAPLVPGVPLVSTSTMPITSTAPLLPGIPSSGAPLVTGASLITGAPISSITSMPNVATAPLASTGISPVSVQPSVSSAPLTGPGATSTPRASISSLDRTHSIESVSQAEWAVPHQTKLKYTQIFNTTDRTRSGYLSGAQARNVMVQTKLPQNILAQIWALSDMDSDGRLGCEEFVLAMHLCEQASLGNPLPTKLPPELIPPSFRRGTRTASISSQGSAAPEQDPASTLLQNSFEDKRKENFEKGQAELERRRKTLLDQQRQEREERERKEREEQEKKEKARQEAERKRLDELEKQRREQQEKERLLEEERKRQAEQREAARKEMERQRQLEWEKQRLQDLQQQRQREQENVLKLKARNQSLTIELSSLNDQVKELSQKICDTRLGVSNERIKLEAKNKLNSQISGQDSEQTKLAFENKEITIKNLKKKMEDMQLEIDGKLSDIENNNSQLTELQNQLKTLVSDCEQLYSVYEQKRETVLEMKNSNRNTEFDAWKSNDTWGSNTSKADIDWPVDNWATSATSEPSETAAIPGIIRYRALYEFVARNNDEISFQPGDIVNVPTEQTGEPESYVEPVDGIGVRDAAISLTATFEDNEATRLEGIAEVPEVSESTHVVDTTTIVQSTEVSAPANIIETEVEPEYYISNYPYQSQEQGDLTFNAGEVIAVLKKEGDWWTGKIGNSVGIFPSNYVQKVDLSSSTNNNAVISAPPASTGVSAEAVQTALESVNAQADNEVSQINQIKTKEVPLDANIQASAQTNSGWWEGELQAKGRKRQVGWFPASYVKVLNSSGKVSGRTTPVSTTRMQQEVVIDKVVALYPYAAGNPDELTFAKDDIISVTAREEEAWWRGELNGVSGLFPSNYVTPLQQQCK
ncbi:hypothetical protein NQ314_003909 [Rhamnusium bicolor]|uniref:Intersectin-1 n=1 Tax=Rhamnusium bicolor TaxID=1586634 RepID=A0AAV8ZMJ6_9CUCU|nr:hypothetical protein NQ314_003909 [Rhamnusium bicolor]